MTSARAYRTELDGAAIGAQAAIEELRRGAGTQFDARVVDALADAIIARSQPVAGWPSTA